MGNCAGKKKKGRTDAGPREVETTDNFDQRTEHQTNSIPTAISPGKKKVHPPLPIPPKPEPSSPKGGVRLFIALFDYDARTSEDLTFKKGDYLEVQPENTAFDWWQAKSRTTKQEGYIPSNYVAEVKTLEAEE